MSKKHLFLLIALMLGAFNSFAAVINVPADYPTIQAGITAAVDGDTVLIASGNYLGEGNKNISFLGKAIVVKSAEGPLNCFIDGEWNGRGFIFTSNEDSNSVLEGISVHDFYFGGQGAGIYFGPSDNSANGPIIKNCRIYDCYAEQYGGGIYADSAGFTLIDCTVRYNSARSGGGIYSRYSDKITIVNSSVTCNNTTDAGGGIWMEHCQADISNCALDYNYGDGDGGAMKFINSEVNVSYCSITHTGAGYNGGGACVIASTAVFQNCTFSTNFSNFPTYFGSGIYFYNCHADTSYIINCVFENSYQNCISIGHSLVDISYSDFYDNTDNFIGEIPEGLEILNGVNANGDSCDVYQNIYIDPMFVSPDSDNYHITSASPCIDAGNPEKQLDPDSTISDIGAFYFDQTSAIENRQYDIPVDFALIECYPNPFNSSTVITFSLVAAQNISLSVFDIQGRKVLDLAEGFYAGGIHRMTFEGGGLSSGIYFCRLQSEEGKQTEKLVLLK